MQSPLMIDCEVNSVDPPTTLGTSPHANYPTAKDSSLKTARSGSDCYRSTGTVLFTTQLNINHQVAVTGSILHEYGISITPTSSTTKQTKYLRTIGQYSLECRFVCYIPPESLRVRASNRR